jgi:hypothetical protein
MAKESRASLVIFFSGRLIMKQSMLGILLLISGQWELTGPTYGIKIRRLPASAAISAPLSYPLI